MLAPVGHIMYVCMHVYTYIHIQTIKMTGMSNSMRIVHTNIIHAYIQKIKMTEMPNRTYE